jgi:hypothetical protein
MCNKFLTLRFRHEQEEVLGFQGRMFFLVFGQGCLCMTLMKQGKGVMEMRWSLWL